MKIGTIKLGEKEFLILDDQQMIPIDLIRLVDLQPVNAVTMDTVIIHTKDNENIFFHGDLGNLLKEYILANQNILYQSES